MTIERNECRDRQQVVDGGEIVGWVTVWHDRKALNETGVKMFSAKPVGPHPARHDYKTRDSAENYILRTARGSKDMVIIESPYAADTERGVADNVAYARACVVDCLQRGEAPYASHLFFTQVLDDKKPEQRTRGINAGLEIAKRADKTVVYFDRGMSDGMRLGIQAAKDAGRSIEYRSLETMLG